MTTDTPDPAAWFAAAPRPLTYFRLRLSHSNGQAKTIRGLLSEAQEEMFRLLDEQRAEGQHEEAEETMDQLRHLARTINEIDSGILELNSSDPRPTLPEGKTWDNDFLRVRLYRGGQADLIYDVLSDAKDELLDRIGGLRGKGIAESHPDIEHARNEVRHVISALASIDRGFIELVGPDGC